MISSTQTNNSKPPLIRPILDILALIGWGGLLMRYWLTGQLRLLIHPNYFILVLLTSLVLLALGILKIWFFLQTYQKKTPDNSDNLQHITVLPRNWGSGLLLITALLGLFIQPTVLTSQMALQRGISDSLPVTRVETQSFRATTKPEDRTLIDWIRTLNAYPEPDSYTGQPVKVTGFVVHLPHLPDNYLVISRFILTCCAVDAYPVGLPVKLEQPRDNFAPDTWLEIEGEMVTETLPIDSQTLQETQSERRQLVIQAKSIEIIDTPSNPYGYSQ